MKGVGLEQARAVSLSGFGMSITAELAYRLARRVSMVAFGALRVNALSRSFLYNQDTIAHEVPRVSALAGLGPRLAF
jgi:hypothetical protein